MESYALQDVLNGFPTFASETPFYSPRFTPSLENKSSKKSSMTKHDVDAFALLCEPLRMMPDVLVIPDEGGHNVSATYESFRPRKPPGKSPEACQMMSKKQYKFRQDVEAFEMLCAPVRGGTDVPRDAYDCGRAVSPAITSITKRTAHFDRWLS